MAFVIHKNTIHFDDRPWCVRGYVFDGSTRCLFTVPEDLIFNETGKPVLEPTDMVAWVHGKVIEIERYCSKFQQVRVNAKRPINDGDEIIILSV